MKIKRLFSVLGLGLFAAASAGVGTLSLRNAQPKEANADAPNTWMVRFQLCLGDCSPNYEGCCFPADKPVDGVRFHYWGNGGVDNWVDAEYMFYFTYDYYGVNVSLKDDQTINGCQWVLEQRGEGDKYSVDITKFGSNEVTSLNKDTTLYGIEYQCDCSGAWVEDGGNWKWPLVSETGHATTYLRAEVGIGTYTYHNFVKDPANNRFIITELEFPSSDAISFGAEGSFEIDSGALSMLDTKSLEYISGEQPNWWYMAYGRYDIILLNGTLKIRRYDSEYVGVYLVNVDENVFVYTFGESGAEEFGAFPGTRLGDIALAQEVSGDLHFQNNDWDIWYLPVNYLYPSADHIILSIKDELGNVVDQTADMLLSECSAYWFSYDDDYHNDDAGVALEFLLDAEYFRINADNESICNIDISDASDLIQRYNSLNETIRSTYVDNTTVYTHKRDGSDGKADVSYRLVMEELAKLVGANLVGGSRYTPTSNNNVNYTTIIIVLAVTLSVAVCIVLILAKKRKHQ